MKSKRISYCHFCKNGYVKTWKTQKFCRVYCRKKSSSLETGWHKQNRDRLALYARNRHRRLMQIPSYKARLAAYRLKKEYGLSLDEYKKLAEAQKGKCAICLCPPSGRWKVLVVDHDHITGQIRGLLCESCNQMLGLAKDQIDYFCYAILYLNRANQIREDALQDKIKDKEEEED